MSASAESGTPLLPLGPPWYYRHSVGRDYGRRRAHLFAAVDDETRASAGAPMLRAITTPMCARGLRAGTILDIAGYSPPVDACLVCLRIGRRIGVIA